VFTAALVVHIAAGATGLVLGPVAMWAGKRRGTHTRVGEVYHWVMLTVCLSAAALALLDWADAGFLLYIAIFSYAFALVGYVAAKVRWRGWIRAHISGQGGSYIALVTAFLIVQLGGNQPLIVWLIPTIIGTPIIAWVNYQVAIGKRPKGPYTL
jgi:uncharacterized membrane protein